MDHWYSTRNRGTIIEVSTIAMPDPCHDEAGNRMRHKEHVEGKEETEQRNGSKQTAKGKNCFLSIETDWRYCYCKHYTQWP